MDTQPIPNRGRNRIVLIFIVPLALLLVMALLIEWTKRNSLFYPERYPSGRWDISHLPVQPVEHWFLTPDGVRLHALFFPSQIEGPGPTLIFFHGNGGNLSHRTDTACALALRGLSVFLFDYRGYGRSEGRPGETELATDSVAAWNYVHDTLDTPPQSIVLFGESLGGAYAAWVASQKPVRSVIIESSFPSLMRMAGSIFPLGPYKILFSRSLTTARWLNQSKRPVLVIHGTRDEVIPYRLGEELHESLQGPKTFFAVEGAGHNDMPSVGGAALFDRIASFARNET